VTTSTIPTATKRKVIVHPVWCGDAVCQDSVVLSVGMPGGGEGSYFPAETGWTRTLRESVSALVAGQSAGSFSTGGTVSETAL
jgi:hypothetical protein